METTDREVLDTAALRTAGRTLKTPFRVQLGLPEAKEIKITRLLRVFPGRRIVAKATVKGGTLDGERVLAKIFIDAQSRLRWKRERDGIKAMLFATIPTPQLLAAGPLPGEGHVLLTEFLRDSDTLLSICQMASDRKKPLFLEPAFSLLAYLHLAGLTHNDLHLNNFLQQGSVLYLIDGDAIRQHKSPLDPKKIARDLGMLIAQLPRTLDDAIPALIGAYRMINPHLPSADITQSAIAAERAWRVRDLMSKTGRDCSLFQVQTQVDRFVAVRRKDAPWLAPVLADPDAFIASGSALKLGNTATVAKAEVEDHLIVIKRYNIKNFLHGLSRMWRPSRAWHAWQEGHRLRLYGISTPRPLAIIEERIGWLRRRAWLITEYCAGSDLSKLDPNSPLAQEATSLLSLMNTLYRTRIAQGDMKATNLLWDGTTVQLIDLDAMRQFQNERRFERAWRRDRSRLLANWPENSVLYEWLNEKIPS